MKKFTLIFISLILVLASVSVCFANDLYIIDPVTGDIVGSDTGYGVDIIRYSSDCTYNISTGVYSYVLASSTNANVECNIYDKMIVTEPVVINAMNPSLIEVYRDGVLVDQSEFTDLRTAGAYIVRDLSSDRQLFGFTIVKPLTGVLHQYEIPKVFDLYSVYLNGQEIPSSGNTVDLTQEGSYRIEYGAYSSKKSYKLEVEIDHTAPVLEISGLDESGTARNIVRLGEREPKSTVLITKDGEEISFSEEFKEAGNYTIAYYDAAGNVSNYYFTIKMFFDAGAWWFIGMFAFVALLVISYLIYSRKHMRVR